MNFLRNNDKEQEITSYSYCSDKMSAAFFVIGNFPRKCFRDFIDSNFSIPYLFQIWQYETSTKQFRLDVQLVHCHDSPMEAVLIHTETADTPSPVLRSCS